jgi:hypothetical protein
MEAGRRLAGRAFRDKVKVGLGVAAPVARRCWPFSDRVERSTAGRGRLSPWRMRLIQHFGTATLLSSRPLARAPALVGSRTPCGFCDLPGPRGNRDLLAEIA